MASSFPSISRTVAFFESPDPARLAAEERTRQDVRAERLRISGFSGIPNVSSSSYNAEVSHASHLEVPPRPARRREAGENPSNPKTTPPPPPPKRDLGYDEAIVDMRRCREEKQNLEHMVERLRRELDRTRNARDMAQAQLEKRQRELVGALDTMRVSEERRIEEAMRVDARAREVEKRADASRRVEDEATRRTIEERLVKEARRKGRREGRRERRRRKVTVVVNERSKSSVAWSLVTAWIKRA